MTLASCSKHLTHAPGCPACEAAEQARRSRKDASRQAREARRAARRQNQLIAEQTAAQEKNNLRLAEQMALQEENNRLLARQNALLEQQAADEAAFRWSMWLQTPDGRILKEWAGRRVAVSRRQGHGRSPQELAGRLGAAGLRNRTRGEARYQPVRR